MLIDPRKMSPSVIGIQEAAYSMQIRLSIEFVVKIFRVCVHSGLTVFGSMLTYNPIRLGLI